jgi:hypothetical protein
MLMLMIYFGICMEGFGDTTYAAHWRPMVGQNRSPSKIIGMHRDGTPATGGRIDGLLVDGGVPEIEGEWPNDGALDATPAQRKTYMRGRGRRVENKQVTY